MVNDNINKESTDAGIIIDASIEDPSQYIIKSGIARGLLRLEISTTKLELRKVISAYPSTYGTLLNPSAYSGLPRKNSACVPITLVFVQEGYQSNLKKPQKREGSWIPNGPVTDKYGNDVKLAGALCKAGFPVSSWTKKATSMKLPKPKQLPLQPVKFRVEGNKWTLI